MSRTKVAIHVFGDVPANSPQERLRQVIHRAFFKTTRVFLRTDRESISTILYDYSPGEPPFFIRSSLHASSCSLEFESPIPLSICNGPPPDVPTDLIVSSHSRAIHSQVLGSPVSMQMDYGLGRLAIVNRAPGDLSLASDAPRSSSLPLVASPIIQDNVGVLRSSVDETDDDNPEPVAHRALRTSEYSEAVGPGPAPMSNIETRNVSNARQLNHTIEIDHLRPSRADNTGAIVQQERANHTHQQSDQSHGPLTIQEFPEPLNYSGSGSRYPNRPRFCHAPHPQGEDVNEPHIAAQVVQPQRGFTTGEQSPKISVMHESLDVNTTEAFADFLNTIDNVTYANLHRRGRFAQHSRGIDLAPSLEPTNQIPDQTQSLHTSSPILNANLDTEPADHPIYPQADEASKLCTQGKQASTEPTPTLPRPTSNPPSIGMLPFESLSPTQNTSDDARRSWRTDERFDLFTRTFDAKRRSREIRDAIEANGFLEEAFRDFGAGFEGEWWEGC